MGFPDSFTTPRLTAERLRPGHASDIHRMHLDPEQMALRWRRARSLSPRTVDWSRRPRHGGGCRGGPRTTLPPSHLIVIVHTSGRAASGWQVA